VWKEKHPRGGAPTIDNFLARQRDKMTKEKLFHETSHAAPDTWLAPMLRRLRWQAA